MANTNEDNVIEKLKAHFSQKYVKPNPVYEALTKPEIDSIIQMGKRNKHPNKDILDELKKAFPDNPGVKAAELVHIRSYPSKLKKTTATEKKDESKKAKQTKANGAPRNENNSNSGNATSSTTNTPVEQPHPEQKAPGNAGVAGSSGQQSGKTEEAANKVNANGATV